MQEDDEGGFAILVTLSHSCTVEQSDRRVNNVVLMSDEGGFAMLVTLSTPPQ
jgi:hypothetical protein